LFIHSNIYTYKCGFAVTPLHSHKSRHFQAMRGSIIPTGLKIWVNRERHAIFVVEFQPSQISPMELLRKSHRTCARWNLLPATYQILLNQHIYPKHIRRHIQLMNFGMIDRPMSKGICCSERNANLLSGLQL